MEPNIVNNPGSETYPTAKPMLGFFEAVKICFDKFFDFTGRARRSEFWWFTLFTTLVSCVCSFVDGILEAALGISFVNAVAYLVLLFPSMTVSWRRLHDVGRSGWWYGISMMLIIVGFFLGAFTLVINEGPGVADLAADDLYKMFFSQSSLLFWLPVIAGFVLCFVCFVFTLLDSHRGENKYGLSPKYQ